MNEFSQKLKKLDLTNEQVASMFGVSSRTIRRWKRGDTKAPSYALIMLENVRLFKGKAA